MTAPRLKEFKEAILERQRAAIKGINGAKDTYERRAFRVLFADTATVIREIERFTDALEKKEASCKAH